MKAWNKDFKQTKGDPEKMKVIPEDKRAGMIAAVERAYSWDKQPFASYTLTNLGATIRTAKKRLEQLEVRKGDKTTEKNVGGVKIIDNVEENRLQMFFPGIPAQKVRQKLKHGGFKWSRYNGCWQRFRSNGANYACRNVLATIKEG